MIALIPKKSPARHAKVSTHRCNDCGLDKPLVDFWIRSKKDNYPQHQCKKCQTARKRVLYAKYREKEKARSKKWNQLNAPRVAANMRRLRENDPEHYKQANKQWKKANPEKVQAYDANKCARRRVNENNSIEKITGQQWLEIKIRQKFRCMYCNKKSNRLTQDHVVPLVSGGSHSSDNIVAACLSCNSRKSSLSIEVFAKRNGRLLF